MFLIIIVFVCSYGFVQEQHLMDVYSQMISMREYISQLEYYTALEKLEWKAKSDREFEEEGLSIYNEHYTDLQMMLKKQVALGKNQRETISMFIHETYGKVTNLLKRLINDKDKQIEADMKELAKMKHLNRDDIQKHFEEYSFLLQKIKDVQDSNKIEDIFKVLELLESKIMIGLFKQHQSQELEFFIKQVDKLFKESSKTEALQLLSLMRSVIQEILLTMMAEQLEYQFDQLDKELFYTQSKNTHIQAKESLLKLIQQFESIAISYVIQMQQWNSGEYNETLLEEFDSAFKHALELGQSSVQYHQQLQDTLKAMLERFLQR